MGYIIININLLIYWLQAKVKVGDILYYWTFVDYFDGERKLGYVKDDQAFTITGK